MNPRIIEFHLKYNPNRKNPAEVFHAMGNFISTYQEMGQLITQSIGYEADFELEMKEVVHGSILARLMIWVDEWTQPNSLLRELTGEFTEKEQVSEVLAREKERLIVEATICGHHNKVRLEPYFDEREVAMTMDKWSEANKKLMPDEKLTISEEHEDRNNVVPFDPNFRFTGDLKQMYSSLKGRHDGPEVVRVFRPCNLGTAKWEFISEKTGKRYSAEITHKEWLEQYQNNEVNPAAKDSLLVHSEYDVVSIDGEDKIRNAQIKQVIDIIRYTGTQNELPE